ncbi:hypothetical protein HZU77_015560 [Neisseriaceae bacterium TC5R-5]|nr:hypothetical protein [Neisseriaceae bacterium TC5R-5]
MMTSDPYQESEMAKPSRKSKAPELGSFSQQLPLILSDGERSLPLGIATVKWRAPSETTLSASQQFTGAVLAMCRYHSALIKNLALRYLWAIHDERGNRLLLSEIDQHYLAEKAPSIKALGIDSVSIKRR